MIRIAVPISPDKRTRLKKLAEQHDRSESNMAKWLLERALETDWVDSVKPTSVEAKP